MGGVALRRKSLPQWLREFLKFKIWSTSITHSSRRFAKLFSSRIMDHSNAASSPSGESPSCKEILGENPEAEAITSLPLIESTPLHAPRHEIVLHPALRGVYNLPYNNTGPHIRLHPVLANADLHSRYVTDPEIVVPRSLFVTSGYPLSSTNTRADGTRASLPIDTELEHSSRNSSTSLIKLLMAEMDAELAVQTLAKYRVDMHTDHKMESQKTIARAPTLPASMVSLASDPEISGSKPPSTQKHVHTLRLSRHRIAKSSVSNLKELAIAEAVARVVSFKDSPDYADYQVDQDLIFDIPEQSNTAAKHRCVQFKETASFAKYAACIMLILEHGDMVDIEIITEPESRRSTAGTPKARSPISW